MRTTRNILALATLVLVMSCGDGGGGSTNHTLTIEKWPPSGDHQTDTVGQTLPLPIRVKVSVDGSVSAGHMVHFAGGDLGTDSMLTGADGIATSTWTLSGQVGTQFVTATLAGATGSPISFSATGITGAPSAIIAVSGDNQLIGRNAFFFSPLVVRIRDAFGNGVPGQWVFFSDSGLVTPGADSIISGGQGDVTLNVHADSVAGPVRIVATAGTLTGSPLLFKATILDTIADVDVSGAGYGPASVTIPHGSAVRWVWSNGTHSVTPDSAASFEGTLEFTAPHIYGPVIFNTPGVYTYHCTVHPAETGTITVN